MADQPFLFQFYEGFQNAGPFAFLPVFKAGNTPYMVEIHRGQVQAFKLPFYFAPDTVIVGGESFSRRIKRNAAPFELGEPFPENGFAFGFEITGRGIEIIHPALRRRNHHPDTIVMIVNAGEPHPAKPQKRHFFSCLTVISVKHNRYITGFIKKSQ
jgi:hypothetical protein